MISISSATPIVLKGACLNWKLDQLCLHLGAPLSLTNRSAVRENEIGKVASLLHPTIPSHSVSTSLPPLPSSSSSSSSSSSPPPINSTQNNPYPTISLADIVVPWRAICITSDDIPCEPDDSYPIIQESFRNYFIWKKFLEDEASVDVKVMECNQFYQFCSKYKEINNNKSSVHNSSSINNTSSSSNSDRKFSFYADYLHFPVAFKELADDSVLDLGDWDSIIGKDNSNKDNLTMWLSDKGAFTPMHFDSYSVNCVCQVAGSKRWRLWRPDSKIPARRIPYEESSIYADIDYHRSHRSIASILPPYLDIVLEAGDFLFLPKHWWHFVETISEVAVSVNMWVSHLTDSEDRLTESIVRLVALSLADSAIRSGLTGGDSDSNCDIDSKRSDGGNDEDSDLNCRLVGSRSLVRDGWICESEAMNMVDDNDDYNRDEDEESGQMNGCGGASRRPLIDHGENVAFLLDSLRMLDGVDPICKLDPNKVFQTIANELLQPDVVTRCKEKVKQLVKEASNNDIR